MKVDILKLGSTVEKVKTTTLKKAVDFLNARSDNTFDDYMVVRHDNQEPIDLYAESYLY